MQCSSVLKCRSASASASCPVIRRTTLQPQRMVQSQAYVEATVQYAITQQALAYAVVLGGDWIVERNSKAAPALPVVIVGSAASLAAVYILNSGVESLNSAALIMGLVSSTVMFLYHAKRTIEADDETVDWPGPKAIPATIALISFFALNVYLQGLRAEL